MRCSDFVRADHGGMKQIVRVLELVRAGYPTSRHIAEASGLSVAAVSSYLTELTEDGLIRRTYKNRVRYAKSGRASHWYEAAA